LVFHSIDPAGTKELERGCTRPSRAAWSRGARRRSSVWSTTSSSRASAGAKATAI